jgi:hypothetical protein
MAAKGAPNPAEMEVVEMAARSGASTRGSEQLAPLIEPSEGGIANLS